MNKSEKIFHEYINELNDKNTLEKFIFWNEACYPCLYELTEQF